MEDFNSDLKLTCEIAFAAQRRGLQADTEKIYDMLVGIRPENACGYIGKALIFLMKNDKKSAVSVLTENEHLWTGAQAEAVEILRIIKEDL